MNTVPFFSHATQANRRSSALLITLLMLSLITIIAVAFMGTMTWESSSARRSYDNQRARALATLGLNTAIAQLRQALDTWDNPYANFATNPPGFFWSCSPGIISRWSYSSSTPITNYPLFSQGSTNLVDLNTLQSDGSYPIASGSPAPNISVYWANVLKNPNQPASLNNQIIGRYAFWVDDENAKININTADGTMKYLTNSLGLGTSSEVSLQALQQGGADLPRNVATNIVYLARTVGLNSPKEILRAAGTTPDLYTNNVFNLTSYSRSPDLNIFGQPKMAMMPVLGDSDFSVTVTATDMTLSGITLNPVKEIYPTPSQLPTYSIANPAGAPNFTWNPSNINTTQKTSEPYPLAFRMVGGPWCFGAYHTLQAADGGRMYSMANYCWINGNMLAQYLGGTNAAGTQITWPPFPGVSNTGFAGKYTPRQIDSIVCQIVSLGSKDISPDYPYCSALTGNTLTYLYGARSYSTPFLLYGWLSHEWVSGMGRTAKMEATELEYTTFGSTGSTNNTPPDYVPPTTTLNIWQEWWMPAEYLGGYNVIPVADGNNYLGPWVQQGMLNPNDQAQSWTPWYGPGANPPQMTPPSVLPSADKVPPAAIPKADGTGSYWGNQLMTDTDAQGADEGLDFEPNPSYYAYNFPIDSTNIVTFPYHDHDQGLAQLYHPYAFDTNAAFYRGTNPTLTPSNGTYGAPWQMTYLQTWANGLPPVDWVPGEMRCLNSLTGGFTPMDMKPTADGSTMTISGGFSERSENDDSVVMSDLDIVPLESLRGNAYQGMSDGYDFSGSYDELLNGENWSDPSGSPVNPSTVTGTVRERQMQSVIPVDFTMPVPLHDDSGGSATGPQEFVLATVADPLVNKFPGDWIVTVSSSPPTVPDYWANANAGKDAFSSSSSEYTPPNSGSGPTFHSKLADPDSYWMPQNDVAGSPLNEIASQTLIPRSARFPNIGYLQYLRTGIIPDDEMSLPYQWPLGTLESSLPLDRTKIQHGTPFRLLSYAPSTDTADQMTSRNSTQAGTSQPYPDWAMLDLMYVPSILAPFGGPYGYYTATNSTGWQGYGNPTILANYSTGGGSTPGRINPNGMVIYTTNTSIPQPGVARTIPMQAMLYGLKVNQDLTPTTTPSTDPNPGLTNGAPVSYLDSDPNSIPQAIYSYLSTNGPLSIPGAICNVQAIADLRPSGPAPAPINPTRNDLVRQIVGNLTTQSDTFSVWAAGESVTKSKANNTPANQGIYEPGDVTSASVRYHFIVERYLDPGADGVYGNTVSPGVDNVVGSYDDPVDPVNHPFQPRYLYRVVSAEEIH